jgi:16S rRNA (guanine966-N2)-methyltransferase
LRIIGGKVKGLRLYTPSKSPARRTGRQLIRPTADRAREALFSIIGQQVDGSSVLDLFAGTGALGLEALSRGAQSAVFVDKSSQAVKLIKKNVELCCFSDRSSIIKKDLEKSLSFLGKLLPVKEFSLIFIDPPYRQTLSLKILKELSSENFLVSKGLVVAEDDAGHEMPEIVGSLNLFDQRKYGDTGFWFYRNNKAAIVSP